MTRQCRVQVPNSMSLFLTMLYAINSKIHNEKFLLMFFRNSLTFRYKSYHFCLISVFWDSKTHTAVWLIMRLMYFFFSFCSRKKAIWSNLILHKGRITRHKTHRQTYKHTHKFSMDQETVRLWDTNKRRIKQEVLSYKKKWALHYFCIMHTDSTVWLSAKNMPQEWYQYYKNHYSQF